MKTQRLAIALTAINLLLLLLNLVQARSTTARTVTPILRARALELVDERNVVRVRLNVKESELNLFDKNGIIRYIDVHDIGEAPENAQILEVLRELD